MMKITDRIYKDKNDIPYIQLLKFSEAMKGNETDIELIAEKTKEFFKTTDLIKFDKALHTDPKKIKFRYKVEIDLSIINTYVDAELFQGQNDIEALLRLFIRPKYRFQKIDIHKLSYAEAEYIIRSFSPAY
jgi:hypothetical protein